MAARRIREGFLEEVADILHGQGQVVVVPLTEVYILGESTKEETEKEPQTHSSFRSFDI